MVKQNRVKQQTAGTQKIVNPPVWLNQLGKQRIEGYPQTIDEAIDLFKNEDNDARALFFFAYLAHKDSIYAWILIAKRGNFYNDIRTMIAEIIWSSRNDGLFIPNYLT